MYLIPHRGAEGRTHPFKSTDQNTCAHFSSNERSVDDVNLGYNESKNAGISEPVHPACGQETGHIIITIVHKLVLFNK